MHLNPIKGAFPHKDQHDRTCPVKLEDRNVIERGHVLYVNKDGEFEIASSSNQPMFPLYLALQSGTDLQATMAGFFGPGVGPTLAVNNGDGTVKNVYGVAPAPGANGPRISGIHMDDGDVWEDDMFDKTEGLTWDVGCRLTITEAGLITPSGATADNCIGFLVKAPYKRYSNNSDTSKIPGSNVPAGILQGAQIEVIQFQCGK